MSRQNFLKYNQLAEGNVYYKSLSNFIYKIQGGFIKKNSGGVGFL